MADYSRLHDRVLRTATKKGADVTFRKEGGDREYDAKTGRWSEPDPDAVVSGKAVEVRGDPEEYAALELIDRDPVTLIFVPNTLGQLPAKDSLATWAGRERSVQKVWPIRPAGDAIAARMVLL